MQEDWIDKIISQNKGVVKPYLEDKDSNDLNYLDNFLDAEPKSVVRNKEPEIELRHARVEMDRRITDSDFRDRFSDKESTTAQSRTEKSFKKALRKITQSYTRSLSLVDELGEPNERSR